MTGTARARAEFADRVCQSRDRLIALCTAFVQTNSENPPGDTTALASLIQDQIAGVPGIDVRRIVGRHPIANLMARLAFGAPGRRLILNAHLDTFTVGDAAPWSVPPLSGQITSGRIYGRGASDMKAGLAAAVLTMLLLAEQAPALAGELVLTLVGDEETGGEWGTRYLLNTVGEARGDAMLSADAGSPRVVRFGEKGQIWLKVSARGVANHGAHVHLGVNAIERLWAAVSRLLELRRHPCPLPPGIKAAIAAAKSVSEAVSGEGEAETLATITVNVGAISGGQAVNVIPDRAEALLDVRIPPGVTTPEIIAMAKRLIAAVPDTEIEVISACEPNVTDPDHEIVRLVADNAREVLKIEVARNMRVGFSDARFYRQLGIPSVVYGPTPHNMGGADEYVEIDDLFAVFQVHALTAYDYLSAPIPVR